MKEKEDKKENKQTIIGYLELIQLIAKERDVTVAEARNRLETVKSTLFNLLKEGKSISLPDFGKFEVSEVKERQGFNPRTKERIVIAARKMVNLFIPVRYSIF